MRKNVLIPAIITILLLGAGAAVWALRDSPGNTAGDTGTSPDATAEQAEQPARQSPEDQRTYTSKMAGVTFTYPAAWRLEPVDVTNVDAAADAATLVSPNGTRISWSSVATGFGGGGCAPGQAHAVINSSEPAPALPGMSVIEASVGGQPGILAVMDGRPATGDTGECALLPTFTSRVSNREAWLRTTSLADSDKDAAKKILESLRYQ